MNKIYYLLIALILTFYSVHTQPNYLDYNLLETHKLILSTGLGPSLSATDYSNTGLGYNIKVSGDYFFANLSNNFFGVRSTLNLMQVTGNDADKQPTEFITPISSVTLGVSYITHIKRAWYPSASCGIAFNWFDSRDSNLNKLSGNSNKEYDKLAADFYFEAGIKYRYLKWLLFYLEGALFVHGDDVLDDLAVDGNPDFYGTINFGVSFALTFEDDSDDDGVPDSRDLCPHTPIDIRVDKHGCPEDTDLDGVPDYRDECPDTPLGVRVNQYGCAFDTDNDGIADHADKCPDTPDGVEVDRNGCPLDSDNDGVPDYIDLCPNTEAGDEVDSSGCYLIDKSKEYLESVIIYFESGSDEISEEGLNKLNNLDYIVENYQEITWYIEGHKDNIEKSKGEDNISFSRAQKVLDYFLAKGHSLSKFIVTDRSDKFSIANNGSIIGRAKNRRVVIFGLK